MSVWHFDFSCHCEGTQLPRQSVCCFAAGSYVRFHLINLFEFCQHNPNVFHTFWSRSDSRVGAAPQGHFLILFSTIFTAPTASYFFLLVQAKVTQKKDTRKLVRISNLNSLISKLKKQALAAQRTLTAFIMDTHPLGLGDSHGASHLIVLKQMLAMILFLFWCSTALNEIYPFKWYCGNYSEWPVEATASSRHLYLTNSELKCA